jgi:hypothetical protein
MIEAMLEGEAESLTRALIERSEDAVEVVII